MLRDRFTPAEGDAITTCYLAGASVNALSTEYRVRRGVIADLVRARGHTVRQAGAPRRTGLPCGLTAAQAREIARRYRGGASTRQLAAACEVSASTISVVLRHERVPLRARGHKLTA